MPLSEPTLSIGGVQFQVIEQPGSLPLDGEQATSIIKFPGGNVNVQTLGAFDNVISLTGTFWYEGALSRALQLDAFRIKGSEVLLRWASIARYVVITKFKPTIYNAEWVDYSIELQPTRAATTSIATAAKAVHAKPTAVMAEAVTTPTAVNSSGVGVTASATQQAVKYRVKAGDTLWKIAQAYYRDGSQYTRIASANGISNPSLITVGQLLTIPQ